MSIRINFVGTLYYCQLCLPANKVKQTGGFLIKMVSLELLNFVLYIFVCTHLLFLALLDPLKHCVLSYMSLNDFPLLANLLPKVLNLIPKDGEPFENALARVCRCIGGGMSTTNEDSDSDLEVIAEAITVNLRCPVSMPGFSVFMHFDVLSTCHEVPSDLDMDNVL
jgi:hypothetical protein